jgi:1,4-alpha-glucan branching enzyme
MLFMGEEWGCKQPFPFFCDFSGDLAEAVRNGRRAEFARFPEFEDPIQREIIPDPTTTQTFASGKLQWNDALEDYHAEWHRWYKRVLALRHKEIVPRLRDIKGNSGVYEVLDEMSVRVRWRLGEGSELILIANLKDRPTSGFQLSPGRLLWVEGDTNESSCGPWSVLWTINERSQ